MSSSFVFPPLPFLHAMRWERTLLGGCPFLVFLVWGFPPPPSPACCARCAHAAVWGGPPLSPTSGCARRLLSPARAQFARAAGKGDPIHPLYPGLALGARVAISGGTPRSLAARRGRALLGGGSPSSFPPLASARINCAQPFRGSPFPVVDSSHAARWERALPGFVPLLRLSPGLVACPPCGLVAVLAPKVSHVVRIDC